MDGLEVSFNLEKEFFTSFQGALRDTSIQNIRGRKSSFYFTELNQIEDLLDLIAQSYRHNA